MMSHTATYSAQDNKLRIYPAGRLDADEYAKVKAAGYAWAPKQGFFVAPMWTPAREDLAIEMAGEIDDEDSTAEERAAQRAERFEGYQESRTRDAESARKAVASIADNIPLGQPILIGHHSERHARKDAERIESGMRRAVRMWETAEYWQRRAAASLRHADYKERADVRARRIKTIEADKRKTERELQDLDERARLWSLVDKPEAWKTREDGSIASREERAHQIASRVSYAHVITQGGRSWTAYDLLRPEAERAADAPRLTIDEILQRMEKVRANTKAHYLRWLNHYTNRLEFERAMLAEQGGTAADKYNLEVGGQILRRGEWLTILKVNRQSVTVSGHWSTTVPHDEIKDYRAPTAERAAAVKKATKIPPLCNYPGEGFKHMTRAELDAEPCRKWSDFSKIARIKETDTHGAHRVQQTLVAGQPFYGKTVPVYITDAKRTDPPKKDAEPTPADLFKRERAEPRQPAAKPEQPAQAQEFAAMKETLRAGVQVVTAPQLFPTPAELAAKVIDLAQIENGQCVLEPSGGTGALIKEIVARFDTEILTYEIMPALCSHLARTFPSYRVKAVCKDFLEVDDFEGCYPRIVMNPPFANGADIKHIQHARRFLAPGGRLVAICANGPRQREELMPLAELWEDLPAGTFKQQGTNVNTALLVIQN